MSPSALTRSELHTLLGRSFRVGESHDATVTGVAFYISGSHLIECSWWSGGKRESVWLAPCELGAEVVAPPPFGFSAVASARAAIAKAEGGAA